MRAIDEPRAEPGEILLTHMLELDDVKLTLFNTVAAFGTARDITLAELAIESFFPADGETAAAPAKGVGALGSG